MPHLQARWHGHYLHQMAMEGIVQLLPYILLRAHQLLPHLLSPNLPVVDPMQEQLQ